LANTPCYSKGFDVKISQKSWLHHTYFEVTVSMFLSAVVDSKHISEILKIKIRESVNNNSFSVF